MENNIHNIVNTLIENNSKVRGKYKLPLEKLVLESFLNLDNTDTIYTLSVKYNISKSKVSNIILSYISKSEFENIRKIKRKKSKLNTNNNYNNRNKYKNKKRINVISINTNNIICVNNNNKQIIYYSVYYNNIKTSYYYNREYNNFIKLNTNNCKQAYIISNILEYKGHKISADNLILCDENNTYIYYSK